MRRIIFLFVFFIAVPVVAQGIPEGAEQAYRNAVIVTPPDIVVPTVLEVELPFVQDAHRSVLIIREGGDTPEPFVHFKKTEQAPFFLEAIDEDEATVESRLVDKKNTTYVEYPATIDGQVQQTSILLRADRPISSSQLRIDLPKHVALPTHVDLKVRIGGGDRVLLSKRRLSSPLITFPTQEAQEWKVTFYYVQPLRISEISLSLDQSFEDEVTERVRFLAQPGAPYTVYFNADRTVELDLPERGNLFDDNGVRTVSVTNMLNGSYVPPDKDGDGVFDHVDNCVSVENSGQVDRDGNGRGDMCDDFDRDSRINSRDNCPDTPNSAQMDQDYDGIGDACDTEDNRPLQREPWFVWIAIGVVSFIVILLLIKTVREQRR